MNFVMMEFDVVQNLVAYCPFKEVQLPNRRVHFVKLDALPATERVEHLLAVCLQMRLVCQIYDNVLVALS